MSQNRLNTDLCAFQQEQQINQDTNDRYFSSWVHENQYNCQLAGQSNLQRLSTRVDIETDLRHYPGLATKCNQYYHKPCRVNKNGPWCNLQQSVNHNICDRNIFNVNNATKNFVKLQNPATLYNIQSNTY